MSSLLLPTDLSRRTAIRLGSGTLAGLLALRGGPAALAADPAHLEANKALVRRVFAEVINAGKTDLLAELYAPGFVNRDTSSRQILRPAGLPIPLDDFRAAFPVVTVTVDSAVAEGNFVATHESWRDRHPPGGTHLVGRTMHLFRIAGGQIAEQWSAGWEWLDPFVEQRGPGESNPLMNDSPAP
jgi:predicted SnoaL-like aldol condensation-catalyzing enzyme